MKKTVVFGLTLAMSLGLTGCGNSGSDGGIWPVLFLLLGLCLLACAALRTYNYIQYTRRRRRNTRRRKGLDNMTYYLYGGALVLLLLALLTSCSGGDKKPAASSDPPTPSTGTTESTDSTEPEQTTPTAPPASSLSFTPAKTENTDPENWNIRWEIFESGNLLHSYTRQNAIYFGDPEDYFSLPGIGAFRGNNYRNSATYGTADVTKKTLSTAWTQKTGSIKGGRWSGNGWTGQPLIVQWDAETRNIMNLYADKKAKDGLVEVIYASLDGKIYFMDLEDGSYTRDPLDMSMCFKGAGSLDPRGYPLLYVGSGDVNADGQRPRMYIISLIDGSVLFQHGYNETLSYRKDNEAWCAFDSSPLVDAETDTLIWPGENGILYTFDLNTSYNKTAGTISIDPADPVITRYHTGRSNEDNYWYGYEASVNIVENYLYVSENGGMFYCVDLNTMELVWAQDTKDDSNSSPVFERISPEEGYVYTAPSLHWTQDSNAQGPISIYKLNALTGEIVWEKPYNVHTVSGVSGGVQSSPLLGKEGSTIDGMILYTISRTPSRDSGLLVALDTETGEEIWRMNMEHYAWSSPVAVYEEDGTAYVVVCDSGGTATFIEGATGKVLDTHYLGGLVEASPAVYEDMLVVGTKLKQIYGIKIN